MHILSLNCYDEDDITADRDDTLQVIAAEIWDRELGDVISGRDISEALGEVLAAMDPHELQALSAANAAGPHALGELLHPMIGSYWSAWCAEKARKDLDKLDREGEEDAASERMEC